MADGQPDTGTPLIGYPVSIRPKAVGGYVRARPVSVRFVRLYPSFEKPSKGFLAGGPVQAVKQVEAGNGEGRTKINFLEQGR
jgi:hypothetical protein